jgi:hypothetical protein
VTGFQLSEMSAIVDPGGRHDLVVNRLGIGGHVQVHDPPKRQI